MVFWGAAQCGLACDGYRCVAAAMAEPLPPCEPHPAEEGANHIIALGRGEGRISRRRKRQQALKEKEVAKRAQKVSQSSAF